MWKAMLTRTTCIAIFVCALFARHAAAASCEDLQKLALPNTAITLAQPVAAGNPFVTLPAYCRVAATLKPSTDSDIKIEVWLPAQGWNGKLEANGNGGWTGSISTPTLAAGVERGYATAMTDTGHQGGSGSFALGHPEKLIDFGYRSTHEMTVAAKAIVRAYYGQAPKLSYFTGCSAGGRQGLMEAQRFPDDYDGIVAGSPGSNWSGRAMLAVWVAQAVHGAATDNVVHKDDASYIPPSKYPLIHAAALSACDEQDGVKDGVIENPQRCKFDPKVLECKGGDAADCLTAPQVEAVRKIYSPVLNRRTGAAIVPGFSPGSELGWATMGGPQPLGLGIDLFRFVVFQDPNWDFRKFDFDEDVARTLKASEMLNSIDPDLRKFSAHGGKLIQYHGWSDPQIAPQNSVDYYKTVLDKLAATKMTAGDVAGFYRLFMVPGMAHCGGGDGASTFDMLAALEQWVEQKNAPEHVLASRIRDGKTDRTRPLCPFPQIAKYKGSGSTDEAANFTCQAQ
jgi:feruloyl esterase